MRGQRFIFMTVALFLFGALPFLIAQPSAAASAGLSLGFSAPIEHVGVLIMVVLVGLSAALLPRDGLLMIPIVFALMVVVGGSLELDISHFTALRYFILGAVLCMGLLVGIARDKLTVLMVMLLASLGFHVGGFFMASIPPIASPMYYLLGVLLSLSMALAITVAFGITLVGDNEKWWERLKESHRVAFIRDLFL